MNPAASRYLLAGLLGLNSLQTIAAEPSVKFLCASENVVYHMYFSQYNKWEFAIEKDPSKYIVTNSPKNTNSEWNVIDGREDNKQDPFISYTCKDGSRGSYLICDGSIGDESNKFNFNFITEKFDRITYKLDWVSDRQGYAMIYQYGTCKKVPA